MDINRSAETKPDLLELGPLAMEELAREMAQPAYRGRQLYQGIFVRRQDDVMQMNDLPRGFRLQLQEKTRLDFPIIRQVLCSRDETRKFLLEFADGVRIEMVAIPHRRGDSSAYTLCLSTQAGCPLACAFCATGASGFKRNLKAGEIASQVLKAGQYLQAAKTDAAERLISNIVLMGMGEPLLNYEAAIQGVRIINEPKGINIGQRRITISTAGVVPGIRRLAEEDLQVTLAVSLHTADNSLRDRLMPVNRKYPLEELMKAIDYYIEKTGRRVSLEYLLLQGINTSREDASRLASLVRGRLVHVNLIPFNGTGCQGFRAPAPRDSARFEKWLAGAGVGVTIRREHGADIDAACGQLAMGGND